MDLTMPEKREFIEKMTEFIKDGILNREDRDRIYHICLIACNRELKKIMEE